ncbi:MAG: PLP-dependent aminotransferase family protein [Proteobacteria bacterium]|nr:PLP-dependent aminotransferase family protein [Pseudomonadota bacterium]
MVKKTGGALFSTLKIDPSSGTPLYRQLEVKIRQIILNGQLAAETRMPATRQLASDLGISRLTVKNVYEQLIAEGFLWAKQGSGTYVARIQNNDFHAQTFARKQGKVPLAQRLSARAAWIGRSKATTRLDRVRAFRPGIPALDLFPRRAWADAYSTVLRANNDDYLGYGPSSGLEDLKQAIVEHVLDHRGIECLSSQVTITSGAQQAFSLVALALLEPEDIVWMEDPGHIAIRDSMRLLGIDVRSVPIDAEGFCLDHAVRRYPQSRVMFTTPSHQHPLGVVMSLNRRLELLDYANQSGSWVVEDDYDSEFHYTERALPALQALDSDGRVLYVGSFSKSLFPALRLGYLICPPDLARSFAAAQTLLSQNVSLLQQKALANFMLDGSFNAHIRKMRLAYRQRRDRLIECLERYASDLFELAPCHAGMHLIAWLKAPQLSDSEVAECIWAVGIDCLPVSIFCDKERLRPGLLFGFACAAEIHIERNVIVLSEAIRDNLQV